MRQGFHGAESVVGLNFATNITVFFLTPNFFLFYLYKTVNNSSVWNTNVTKPFCFEGPVLSRTPLPALFLNRASICRITPLPFHRQVSVYGHERAYRRCILPRIPSWPRLPVARETGGGKDPLLRQKTHCYRMHGLLPLGSLEATSL